MENSTIWYLENIDVSQIFCPQKMEADSSPMNHKSFKKNDYVYVPDQASDTLYFISNGRVKIGSFNEEGKEIIKAVLSKGEVFGEHALMGEKSRRDFAVAVEETTLCSVRASNINELIKDHSHLSMFFMKLMLSLIHI